MYGGISSSKLCSSTPSAWIRYILAHSVMPRIIIKCTSILQPTCTQTNVTPGSSISICSNGIQQSLYPIHWHRICQSYKVQDTMFIIGLQLVSNACQCIVYCYILCFYLNSSCFRLCRKPIFGSAKFFHIVIQIMILGFVLTVLRKSFYSQIIMDRMLMNRRKLAIGHSEATMCWLKHYLFQQDCIASTPVLPSFHH